MAAERFHGLAAAALGFLPREARRRGDEEKVREGEQQEEEEEGEKKAVSLA